MITSSIISKNSRTLGGGKINKKVFYMMHSERVIAWWTGGFNLLRLSECGVSKYLNSYMIDYPLNCLFNFEYYLDF